MRFRTKLVPACLPSLPSSLLQLALVLSRVASGTLVGGPRQAGPALLAVRLVRGEAVVGRRAGRPHGAAVLALVVLRETAVSAVSAAVKRGPIDGGGPRKGRVRPRSPGSSAPGAALLSGWDGGGFTTPFTGRRSPAARVAVSPWAIGSTPVCSPAPRSM